jgi:hypothetical protein
LRFQFKNGFHNRSFPNGLNLNQCRIPAGVYPAPSRPKADAPLAQICRLPRSRLLRATAGRE